jgi:hypothetical protein
MHLHSGKQRITKTAHGRDKRQHIVILSKKLYPLFIGIIFKKIRHYFF